MQKKENKMKKAVKNPYRETGFARVAAVKRAEPSRRGAKIEAKNDLRVK